MIDSMKTILGSFKIGDQPAAFSKYKDNVKRQQEMERKSLLGELNQII